MSRALGSLKLTDLLLLEGEGGGPATTTDLPEGSNLYYTNARVAAYLTGLSGTDDSSTFLRGDNTWNNTLIGDLGLQPPASGARSLIFAYPGDAQSVGLLAVTRGATADLDAVKLGRERRDTALYSSYFQFSDRAVFHAESPTIQCNLFVDPTVGLGEVKADANRLYVNGRIDVDGGLNLGTATSAATGEIRASAGARLGAALLASTDATYDIGASGATRFRDLYQSRDGYFGGRVMAVQPAARVTHNTTQSVSSASATALAFNTEDFDTDTIHDTATNNSRLTCKTAGKYLIVANMDWGNFTGGNRRITQAVRNGSTIVAQVENPPPATSSNFLLQAFVAVANLAANDYVEMKVYQDSSGSYTVPATTNGVPAFSMAYLGT